MGGVGLRDILFRGADKDGKWVYGYYLKALVGLDGGDEINKHYITEYDPIRKHFCDVEVYPETVGQFTGVHDKNGNEVCEGDILYTLDRPEHILYAAKILPTVVSFKNGCFYAGKELLGKLLNSVGTGGDKVKVIGNIHDNPELLGTQ